MKYKMPLGLALGAVVLLGSLVLAGKPQSDPIIVSLSDPDLNDPNARPYIHHDGRLDYIHDDPDGVHAVLPGTGNIVLDPDRNAAKNDPDPRSIVLRLPGVSDRVQRNAFFMSINAAGIDCFGNTNTDAASKSPRDLGQGECIQCDVAVNEIAGLQSLLRCGDAWEDAITVDPSLGPEVDLNHVAVTCDEVDDADNRCKLWSIAPHRTDGVLNCALFELQRFRGKGMGFVRVSDAFDMSFWATVTRP